MNMASTLNSLDPAQASDQAGMWMCAQVFNGLVSFGDSLEILPAIARTWDISPDGLRYTFHLRQDVWYHSSPHFHSPDSTRRVVAADFVYSFRRICDKGVASPGFWLFNGKVKGAAAWHEDPAAPAPAFTAPDDSTFVIELEQAFPPFLAQLAMPYAAVLPEEVVSQPGLDFSRNPVGTGPFLLHRWREGQSLILHRNPRYFEQENGRALPYMDAVQVRFIRSRLSEFVEFRQGRLDFLNGIDKSWKDEVFDLQGNIRPEYASQYQFTFLPQLNTEFLAILSDSSQPIVQNHPLRDKRVRQALAWAIDRGKMVRYLLAGNGTPATAGMIPAGMPGFDSTAVHGYGYDPARAAALLAAAGYPAGRGLPVLSLKSNPAYQPVMEFVQKSWERIGVRCQIDNMDGPTLRGMAKNAEINLWRASWIADYPDAETYLSLFRTASLAPAGPNRMRYSRAGYDSLYAQAMRIPQDSLRYPLYHAMDQEIIASACVIPLFYDRILHLTQKGVRGLPANPMNMLYLKRVQKGL